MSLGSVARAAALRMRAEIERACPGRLRELRVFGSRARGDAGVESDLDLLVLVDREDSRLWDGVYRASAEVEREFG
ncbi:MAG: nucleotidyltransferase domain-containing protein, partial [Armatimonadetes bacterium]|nr:nucleotidyltransferase domain-containing protein [Armatimonadota bacterium]